MAFNVNSAGATAVTFKVSGWVACPLRTTIICVVDWPATS